MNKKMLAHFACAAAACLITAQSGSAQDIPTGTSFCIQAESIPVVSPWQKKTDKDGYFGSCYFYYNSSTRGKGTLEYHFNLTKSGAYRIRYHGRRDREGICAGARDDECNDIFTSITGHWSKCKTMVKKGGWGKWFWEGRIAECGSWDTRDMKADLKEGKNTFTIIGRSKGVCIDAITIYPEGESQPVDACKDGSVAISSRLRHTLRTEMPDREAVVYSFQGKALRAVDGRKQLKAFLQSGASSNAVVVRYDNGNTVRLCPISR